MQALSGALYVVGKYISGSKAYSNFLLQLILALVIVYIAFSPKDIKQLFKYTVIFYLTSFVFGGCAYSLLYYVKPQEILYKNGNLTGTYPIKIAFLGAMVGLIILNIAFKVIKNRISKKDMFCNIKIGFEEKIIKVKAIIDSGNLLKEPITGASVIVIEKEKLEEIIDKNILDNLQDIMKGKTELTGEEYISKFRLIPFSSLGKENGMLLGFKPDSVEIEFDGINNKIEKAIIGIYEKKLSKSEQYAGLVGLDVLDEKHKSFTAEIIK